MSWKPACTTKQDPISINQSITFHAVQSCFCLPYVMTIPEIKRDGH